MSDPKHITIDQIDRLRAGLLDDDLEQKRRVETALENDLGLTAEYARWERVQHELETASAANIALNNRLRLQRRKVLSGNARKKWRISIPQLAFATATGFAFTLAVSLWLYQDVSPQKPQQVATQTVSKDQPDLTDNVEFYGWLEDQGDLVDL